MTLKDLADENWVLAPRSSWEPWHLVHDKEFGEAGFVPKVVQRDPSPQGLLGLVAAGVGVTWLARSANSLRRTGVVFVPINGEFISTEMVWLPGNTSPALQAVLEIVTEVAAESDVTTAG